MVGQARRRLADRIADGTARVVLARSDVLPFADEGFSAVTAITAPLDLDEVHRVLRPGGRMVVVDELIADPGKPSRERTGSVWRDEADTLSVIAAAGFVDLTVRYRGVWHVVDNRIIHCTKPAQSRAERAIDEPVAGR